jgi:hypothetical protein
VERLTRDEIRRRYDGEWVELVHYVWDEGEPYPVESTSVLGPAGDEQPGYLIRLETLSVLGLRFRDLPIAVYDFENFGRYQIDGLLGFDVIRWLRLELDGTAGLHTILS